MHLKPKQVFSISNYCIYSNRGVSRGVYFIFHDPAAALISGKHTQTNFISQECNSKIPFIRQGITIVWFAKSGKILFITLYCPQCRSIFFCVFDVLHLGYYT